MEGRGILLLDPVAKGNRLQVLARKLLEEDGYTVHTAVRSVQRRGPIWISQTTDIFNAFDLIATRMDGDRPLRFIQVTVRGNTSERIKKVDPVPINGALASVEIWAWVGGQKRLDRRYKTEKVWLPRNFFQVLYKERNWEPHPDDRVYAKEGLVKVEAKVPRSEPPSIPVAARPRTRRTAH